MQKPAAQRQLGFTIIDIMIAITIIGVIVAWALPNYREMVLKSHRKDMQGEMLEMAAEQELIRSDTGAYATQASSVSENGRYNVAVTLPAGRVYLITATAINDQSNDSGCTTLTVDGIGNRSPQSCWTR